MWFTSPLSVNCNLHNLHFVVEGSFVPWLCSWHTILLRLESRRRPMISFWLRSHSVLSEMRSMCRNSHSSVAGNAKYVLSRTPVTAHRSHPKSPSAIRAFVKQTRARFWTMDLEHLRKSWLISIAESDLQSGEWSTCHWSRFPNCYLIVRWLLPCFFEMIDPISSETMTGDCRSGGGGYCKFRKLWGSQINQTHIWSV